MATTTLVFVLSSLIMGEIVRFDTVNQYNAFHQHETLHPLVSVVDLAKAQPRPRSRVYGGLYAIFLKEVVCGDLRYGRQLYDYQEGSLVFFAPGQVVGVENEGEYYQPQGYALVFHPDLLLSTALKAHIHEYSFFSYQAKRFIYPNANGRLSWIVWPRSTTNSSTPSTSTAKS